MKQVRLSKQYLPGITIKYIFLFPVTLKIDGYRL